MKRNLAILGLVALCAVLVSSGCVPPLFYKDMTATLSYVGSGPVAVAALDQRDYIKSGQTQPAYEGQVRSTVGIPYQRVTSSGLPLASEMGKALATSLQQRGFQVIPLETSHSEGADAAGRRLGAAGGERGVLLVVQEWMYDGYASYNLNYNLRLNVVNRDGTLMASAETKGEQNLGGNPQWEAKNFFRGQLERLLLDPRVAAALSPAPAPTQPPVPVEPPPPAEPGAEPPPTGDAPPPADAPTDNRVSAPPADQ